VGRRDETHQMLRPRKYASDKQQDPNTNNLYVHHCIREKRTDQTEW
jgi:hypothetical protein